MSICFEHEDKMCVLILNEHDPLTKEDSQLFYDTLDGLLTYANEQLHIVDRKRSRCTATRAPSSMTARA